MTRQERIMTQDKIKSWDDVKVTRKKTLGPGMLSDSLIKELYPDHKPSNTTKFGLAVMNTREFRSQRSSKNHS